VSATVPVTVETLEAIIRGLHDSIAAASRVSMELDDVLVTLRPAAPQKQPATLAPVVSLDDYRKARGGAA
jgi:hypothetical protein